MISSYKRKILGLLALVFFTLPILIPQLTYARVDSMQGDDPVPGCTRRKHNVVNNDDKSDNDGKTYDDWMDGNGNFYKTAKACRDAVGGNAPSVPVTDVPSTTSPSYTSDSSKIETACKDADLGLKWVLCPTLEGSYNTVGGLDSAIGAMVDIDSSFYKTGSATNTAWESFRNIANVCMIIFFMIIIYSQITGHGIDNYGIKKMLPRFIVMALVINLSFLICQLAIDLSNIIGYGLDGLFRGFSGGLDGAGSAGESFASKIIEAIVVAATAGGSIAGVGLGVGISAVSVAGLSASILLPVILITLAIVIIIIIVSILLFFGMLGVRMVIVIGAILISPIAFASYILPNTQWFFKKWWSISKVALIIYPICGAVLGMSSLIKAIVLRLDGIHIFTLVVLCLAPYLPFFFIPTLLMSAINALGAIGGAVTSMGRGFQRAGRQAQDAVRNGAGAKEAQQRAQEFSERARQARRANWQFDRRTGTVRTDANGMPIERKRGRFSRVLSPVAERERDAARAKLTQAMNADAMNATYSEDGVIRSELAKGQNAATMHRGEGSTTPFMLTQETANRRASAAVNAQEFKAAQDQYASYGRNQLVNEADNISSWYDGTPPSSQRLAALLGTMESNGMEKDVFKALHSNPNIGKDETVTSVLKGSKNKVLKAFGKSGNNQSFTDFMQGTGENSMQSYINKKESDFLTDLDDKAISEIRQAEADSGTQIMPTSVVQEAMTKLSGEALGELNQMAGNRTDYNFSTEQLSKIRPSTIETFKNTNNSSAMNSILEASKNMENNPQLVARTDPTVLREINNLRQANGLANLSAVNYGQGSNATNSANARENQVFDIQGGRDPMTFGIRNSNRNSTNPPKP